MDIVWSKERMSDSRIDLDLFVNGSMVGYFRRYRVGHFEWVGDHNDWNGEIIDQPSLKKAKKVVEALVLLEG